MSEITYISGLSYISTVDDVVETLESLISDSDHLTGDDFINDLQGCDCGLSLYKAKLLLDEYKRLLKLADKGK